MPDSDADFEFAVKMFADKRKIKEAVRKEYGNSHGNFMIDCPFCGGIKAMTTERNQYDFKAHCANCHYELTCLGW